MRCHYNIANIFQNLKEIEFALADYLLCQTILFARINLVCIFLQILNFINILFDFVSIAILIFICCLDPFCFLYFIFIFVFDHLLNYCFLI